MKSQIKSKIRETVSWGYYLSKHFLSRLKGKVLILTYHRVLSDKEIKEGFIQPGMYVDRDAFEMQMAFLREHFEVIPFADLLELWNRGFLDEQKRYCVITFDDGWLDNYLYAFPVLRKYQIPATIFLPTDFIGTKEWFWPDRIGYLLDQYRVSGRREPLSALSSRFPQMKSPRGGSGEEIDLLIEALKGLPEGEIKKIIGEIEREMGMASSSERLVVSWDEVEEMSSSGIAFGSHSATHKILTKLSPAEIQKELERSSRALQREKVNTLPVFCYPNGSFNHLISEQVKEAGYKAAVTTQFGFESRSPSNFFELKRIGIHQDITATAPLFSWHLSGLNHF